MLARCCDEPHHQGEIKHIIDKQERWRSASTRGLIKTILWSLNCSNFGGQTSQVYLSAFNPHLHKVLHRQKHEEKEKNKNNI